MKKSLFCILVLVLSLALFACSGSEKDEDDEDDENDTRIESIFGDKDTPSPTEEPTMTSSPEAITDNDVESGSGNDVKDNADINSSDEREQNDENLDNRLDPTLIPGKLELNVNEYALQFKGSPIIKEELLGSWEISDDSILDLVKSGLYYELGGDLTLDSVIKYMYENHDDIESYIDAIEGVRVEFAEQICYAFEGNSEWEYEYELTPVGVNIIDPNIDYVMEFIYDKENARLIYNESGKVLAFYKNLNRKPYQASSAPEPENNDENEDVILNVYSHNSDLGRLIQLYISDNPDCGIEMKEYIIDTTAGQYDSAVEAGLTMGGPDAPDIYASDIAYIGKYIKGDASYLAATYKDLGIDIEKGLRDAKIPQYAYEIGTRPEDQEIIALPFTGNAVSFIYRRSIAKEIWGTDDPEQIQNIIGGGSGSWDKFFSAAKDCSEAGYVIVPSTEDIWRAYMYAPGVTPWVVNGRLNIDVKREAYLDIAKLMDSEKYEKGVVQWSEAWFDCMKSDAKVLGFFGPSWFIEYTLRFITDVQDDWAICCPPTGGVWGGTYVLANSNLTGKKKEAVAKIINYLTLDCSENGAQHKIAIGFAFFNDIEDVASKKVKENVFASYDFLGGQNPFPVWNDSGELATGSNYTQYDEQIDMLFKDCVKEYVVGNMTRDEAIENFRERVEDSLAIR